MLRSHIAAALAVAESVKATYGPCGADKLIVGKDGSMTITNGIVERFVPFFILADGATLLKMLQITNPVARLLVEISTAQDEEVF